VTHEREPVAQAERWGPLYYPAYLLGSLRGYRRNPFERAARRTADAVQAALEERGRGRGERARGRRRAGTSRVPASRSRASEAQTRLRPLARNSEATSRPRASARASRAAATTAGWRYRLLDRSTVSRRGAAGPPGRG